MVIGLAPNGIVFFKEIKVVQNVPSLNGEGSREVLLTWDAPSAAGYVVEMSTNLLDWETLPVKPTTSGLRSWVSRVTIPPTAHCFFRIRWEGLIQHPDR